MEWLAVIFWRMPTLDQSRHISGALRLKEPTSAGHASVAIVWRKRRRFELGEAEHTAGI